MIKENLKFLQEEIESYKIQKNIRQKTQIIAVSKTFPATAVREAYQSGQIVFGENKVQEAQEKISVLADLPLEWHLIGHLQTNKANKAAELFNFIHSVDSFKLAQKISEKARELQKNISILLQINTSGEQSKNGYPCDYSVVEEQLVQINALPNLMVKGLMTIGPLGEDQGQIHKAFENLRNLRDRLATAYAKITLPELSMGMSGDYLIALEEGSTMLRIGSAIFGGRQYAH